MPENPALLQAVLDHPDDDAPRLAYAAWLDGRHDPRGEFIRVQCALAGMTEDGPQRATLVARERELLQAHARNWIGIRELFTYLPGVDEHDSALVGLSCGPNSHPGPSLRYRRGFPEELTLNAGLFAAHADALCRLGPLRVHATAYNDVAYSDWADDNLSTMREQEGYDRRLRDDLAALVGSPYTDRVTSLTIDAAGKVRNDAFPEIIEGLSTGASWPNLTVLAIGHDSLTTEQCGRLARWPVLAQLTDLNLSGTSIGDAGVRALFTGAELPALKRLSLAGIGLQDEGVRALAESAQLPTLRDLDLGDYEAIFAHIGDKGVRAIAGAAHLAGLRSLRLRGARLPAAGVQALDTAAFWPGLRSLDLGGAFDTNPAWDHTYPCLDRDGLQVLLAILPASSVDELRLSHNNLDDTDIALLVAAPASAQLRLLDLGDTLLTDAGATTLITAPTLAGLITLKLWTHNLGEETKRALRQRFGNAL